MITGRPQLRHGISIVGVLVTSAMLALSGVALLRYLHTFTRIGAKQQKAVAQTTIDANVRALLGHRLSCIETFGNGHINFNVIDTEQPTPLTIYEKASSTDTPVKAFYPNLLVNGVLVKEIGATVGATTGNANMIRVRVLLQRRIEGMPLLEQTQYYFVHTLRNGATVDECFYADSPDALTLVKIEPITVPASLTNPRASTEMTDPVHEPNQFGPPGWETLDSLTANPPSPCGDVAQGVEPACPQILGPTQSLTVHGNFLMYSFQTRLSMGIGSSPMIRDYMDWQFTPAIQAAMGCNNPKYILSPAAFGAHLDVQLLKGATVVKEDFTSVSEAFQDLGFHQESITTPLLPADVTYGQSYQFRMAWGFSGSPPPKIAYWVIPCPPPPPPGVAIPPPPPIEPRWSFAFSNWRPLVGTVFHYIKTPPPAGP